MTRGSGNRIGFWNRRRFLIFPAISILPLGWLSPAAVRAQRDEFDVKVAFREAARGASRSVVTIFCGGRRTVLGTVIASDGYVVTKASELQGSIACQFHGIPARTDAHVVGVMEDCDLALLRVQARNLPVIAWSETAPPQVGSWLATVGMDELPLAIGVVSLGPREIPPRVAALGVVIEDAEEKRGARVYRVVPSSCADRAGIRPGDVITHLEAERITSRDELIASTREFSPGDKVSLQVSRGERTVRTAAILDDLASLSLSPQDQPPGLLDGRLSKRRAGFPMVIQHDSALQPQQCGGPLVGLDGKAVGINIARASRVASYAIPASVVRSAITRLVAEWRVDPSHVD
jgi:serine protease Do